MSSCSANTGSGSDLPVISLHLWGVMLLCILSAPSPVLGADDSPWQHPSVEVSGQTYKAEIDPEDDAVRVVDGLQDMVETANGELSELLREDLRFSRESLLPLADYLNFLFPELDLGAPETLMSVQLSETQLDRLLNLYFNLLEERIPNDADRRSYLQELGFSYSSYLARRLSEQAQQYGECLAAEAKTGDLVSLRESAAACADGPPGQTIWVNRILITDPATLTADGIDGDEVEKLLETARQKYMGDPAQGIGGFPVENLLGLVQALSDVYAAGGYGGQVSAQMMVPVMEQLERMRRARGISFSQLQAISLELQSYLRQQGYFLADAYIPGQDFNQATGEVVIATAFGTLGDVSLNNPDDLHYANDVLLDPFRDFLGEKVSRDIYSAYFAVNDLPGVRIRSGLFEAGDQPGETRLVLDVEEERFRVSLAADNYGSEFTGEERAIVSLDWYSPLGQGDSLSLGILQSIDPADSTYGFVNYSLPLFNIAHELAASWDTHDYDSIDGRTGTQVLVHGEVDSLYIGYDYKWRRSKSANVQFGLRGFQKKSDTSVNLPTGSNTEISKQTTDVTGALISTEGDVLLRDWHAIVGWQATLLYGEQEDSSNFRVADDYIRFSLETKGLMVLPWGPGADVSHLSVRFVGAYSGDVLPSFEQTPLGGPFGARAFKSYDFTADSLAFLTLEWRVDVGQHLFGAAAVDNSLRLGVFAEAGYGEANGIGSAEDSWAEMSAYGLLLGYRWRDKFTIETSLALPGHDETSNDFRGEISDDDYTFLFDVRYLFY